ncbi:PP-loop domain protein [Desulfovibrio sp. X2]|uniref:ATP-binding protein n=1 Tax=Desulfovibrio sp. X2 TaxID=941449 RepID=UPI000358C6FF|nr:ATP-binding protein [Desulfovibrio sp. X2]EPR37016.1 PP-loop domain protein [Desulfovibrio sp. X2]
MKCRRCKAPAQVKLPSHHTGFCPDCFFLFFSRQVAKAVKDHDMFGPDDRILVALSGGKDSLALANELKEQGYDVTGLHVYLGIPGSSDASLAHIEAFCEPRNIPLIVASTPEMGLAIPEVKRALTSRPVCSACGKIKRHVFNKVAREQGFDVLATGHNLDDETARLFANVLRWDAGYLSDQGPSLPDEGGFARKVKPLYRLTEFETACYSFLKGIDNVTAPCPYSPGASFTGHKELLENLEATRPGAKTQFYESFLSNARHIFSQNAAANPELAPCTECGSPTSRGRCGVCGLKAMVRAAREARESESAEAAGSAAGAGD